MGIPVAGTAVAVAAVLVLFLVVRFVQGAPPAATWDELQSDSRASVQALAGPGDHYRVIEAGDSFWSLAVELDPEGDPRPIVDALVAVNGGSSELVVGQRIVVPAALLNP